MTDAVSPFLKSAPWDVAALGYPAWELTEYSAAALAAADTVAGHQTVKLDPLADKGLLHQHGFYYADTLLETVATREQLRALKPLDGHNMSVAAKIVSIRRDFDLDAMLAICHGAFAHGRFHRDFQVDPAAAALRYDNWLRQLAAADQVVALYAQDQLAGFIGYHGNALVLHAVAAEFRGRGLAKYWWRQVIVELLNAGHDTVTSSISASNLAVLNLYATQGFSFRHPQDIYHRIVK
ncbi:GNAT family N-acetyltransferase [Duganella sp. CY15W]|uniref:GNAT family N-acetyltransferase n=1 Tax=Duganella sp. CY15W TaxID=2692172 RepID=UPI0013699645|nr:GNAT family N-acetyltransferase [Duganella sp. CY15W]MYM30237.1 GNAT family N-acetyltransferase [Duganella sp. CY15W]